METHAGARRDAVWPGRAVGLRAIATVPQAARRYERLSPIYDVNAFLGSATSARAIAGAALATGDTVIELGIGTGRDLVRLGRQVGRGGRVLGVDLARGMLRRAQRRATRAGCGQVALQQGDARHLPVRDGAIDVVFASRLLDLLDLPDIVCVLEECRRVLRPGGRLVVVHMSKRGAGPHWFERLYALLSGARDPLVISRPVLVAPALERLGFEDVRRGYYRAFPVGAEIVSGVRPG